MEYSFYQTYTWNCFLYENCRSWHKKLEYMVVYADGKVESIVPLVLKPAKKEVRIISGRIAGILNVVCPYRDEQAQRAMDVVVQKLKERFNDGWRYNFHDMPLDALFRKSLSDNGFAHTERGSYHIPLTKFSSYNEYLSSLGKNIYKNIRKAYNHLSTDGKAMQLHHYTQMNPPSRWLSGKIWRLYFRRKLAWQKKKHTFWKEVRCVMKAFSYATAGIQTKSMFRLQASELFVLTIDGQIAAF
ncbi:MAG: hypothetical protein J1F25_08395, partial [Prevotellaceae bacterium]|nr:hypothetical protein [Prevotellaceae bacterium]